MKKCELDRTTRHQRIAGVAWHLTVTKPQYCLLPAVLYPHGDLHHRNRRPSLLPNTADREGKYLQPLTSTISVWNRDTWILFARYTRNTWVSFCSPFFAKQSDLFLGIGSIDRNGCESRSYVRNSTHSNFVVYLRVLASPSMICAITMPEQERFRLQLHCCRSKRLRLVDAQLKLDWHSAMKADLLIQVSRFFCVSNDKELF